VEHASKEKKVRAEADSLCPQDNIRRVWGHHLVCSEGTAAGMYKSGADRGESVPDFPSFHWSTLGFL